jgi:hypothetical protein
MYIKSHSGRHYSSNQTLEPSSPPNTPILVRSLRNLIPTVDCKLDSSFTSSSAVTTPIQLLPPSTSHPSISPSYGAPLRKPSPTHGIICLRLLPAANQRLDVQAVDKPAASSQSPGKCLKMGHDRFLPQLYHPPIQYNACSWKSVVIKLLLLLLLLFWE